MTGDVAWDAFGRETSAGAGRAAICGQMSILCLSESERHEAGGEDDDRDGQRLQRGVERRR